jgi:hypothetical protein
MVATLRKKKDFTDVARAVGALWVEALYRAQQLTPAQAEVLVQFVSEIGDDFCYAGEPASILNSCAGPHDAPAKWNAWNWLIEKGHIVNIGGDLFCLELTDDQLAFLHEMCEEIQFNEGAELLHSVLN